MVFQGGSAVELLSGQGSQPLINWSATTAVGAKQSEPVSRCYEREIKGYCHVLNGSGKLHFPKSTELKGAD
jgi:hypothetical protein